ncbi:hypothetical protein ABZ897_53710 [Nonomuraea sp. NPDC046802]
MTVPQDDTMLSIYVSGGYYLHATLQDNSSFCVSHGTDQRAETMTA